MIECFFFIEPTSDDDVDGIVRALCLECRKNLPKEFPAWFYSGEVGPWTVTCNRCNEVIYLHKEANETQTTI